MKKLTSLIIVLLIAVGVLLMVLSKGRKAQREPDIKTTSVDTAKIHAMRVALQESLVTIEALQDSLAVMDSIINNNQTKVIYIKKKANEKANSVSKWSSTQFNEFLSDRYKDSIR